MFRILVAAFVYCAGILTSDRRFQAIGSVLGRPLRTIDDEDYHGGFLRFQSQATDSNGRRAPDLVEWLSGAAINRDRNLRMQYLASFGLNLDDRAAIYADMLEYRRFPTDIFVGDPARVRFLQDAVQNGEPQ
jgi:hypothetical protein